MFNIGADDQGAGNLSEEDWDVLIKRVKEGSCTPFLGAGVNSGLLPLGATIASEWAKEYGFPLREKFDLARVSQYLALTKPEKVFPKYLMRDMIQEKLKKHFSEDAPPNFTAPNHPLGVLAALPLPIYITTNYDDFMYRALRDNRKNPKVELCAWNSHLQKKASVKYPNLDQYNPPVVPRKDFKFEKSILTKSYMPAQNLNEPIVYHLHGHYSSVDSMVLTENDYLDFLVNMSKDQKLLPSQIKLALTNASLLFMGYSLADPNFRVLFRGLIHSMGENRRLSVSIQLRPGDLSKLDTKPDDPEPSDNETKTGDMSGLAANRDVLEEQDENRELTEEEKHELAKREEEKRELARRKEEEKRALQFLEKYFGDLNIKVFWGSAEEFAAQLWRRFNL